MDQNITTGFAGQQEAQNCQSGQHLVYWQELREKEEQRLRRVQEQQRGGAVFNRMAAASMIYALVYTLCLYHNRSGITSPFWVAATVGYAWYGIRMFGVAVKRDSGFIAVVMFLLGVSNFLTGNEWIILLNYTGIFLLLVALLLHNFAQDHDWDVGMYLSQIAVAVFGAVGCIGKPFSDGAAYRETREKKSSGRGVYVALGIAIAIPCVLFLGVLLATADMVFADMIRKAFSTVQLPAQNYGILFMLAFGFFSSYCGMRFIESHASSIVVRERRNGEPLIAITVTGAIALLYLVFCLIQIAYLFLGNLTLPEGVTYAEYARSGFFQLLFVCIINLLLVLAMKKYFREDMLLNILLLVISGCTFVMTASSAWRMLLYIRAYQLTFLRVSVLVALAAIALLMAGVALMIVNPKFPLFGYGLCVVCGIYLMFSFSHVDYFIASYNLSHTKLIQTAEDEQSRQVVDYGYIYSLSTDAAPAIAAYLKEHPQSVLPDAGWEGNLASESHGWVIQSWVDQYLAHNHKAMTEIGVRNFNVSHYVAYRLFSE